MTLLRALLAEVIGTFILVGMGSLAVVSATPLGSSTLVLLVAPFGFGLGLLVAITIFGHVSGGHFNPAVSLAAILDGRIDVLAGIAYMVAQVAGAILASLMILVIVNKDAVAATVTAAGVGEPEAFALETVLTAILVAVILTVTRKQPSLAALVIGLTLVAIHFAAIPISGSSVNPARSLGPAMVAGKYAGLWVYLAGPMLGGLIGWGMYRFFTPPDDEEELEYEDEEDLDEELEAAG
ncbi:MAG TPA: aquaporin [Candidatus Limnocylindrales bacterium]|nr:aquaporin [Candidatus Limnocylindrales bacterium]